MSDRKRLVDTNAAAEWLGISPHTLATARVRGTPRIPFVKLGRRVLYDVADLEAIADASKRASTSDAGPKAAA